MTAQLDQLLKKYVREDQAFGPADAADVTEPMCAAALFDWNNQAFAELLVGSDVLVGRRGSGKSSLLRTFPARKYLTTEFRSDEARGFRDRYHISAKVLSRIPDFVVDVDTPKQVNELESYCVTQPVVPPVEMLASMWRRRLWWLIGQELQKADGPLWDKLPEPLRRYITNRDIAATVEGSASNNELSAGGYIAQLEDFLLANNARVVVTFDNVEQHTFKPVQNAVLGGLIAATGKFIGAQHPSVDVKLCLPAELFRELQRIAFRPDKDFHRIQYLHWNAAELLHLAARRLRIYLSLWDHDEFDLIKDKGITDRTSLMDFWHRYLPQKITNSVDVEEDTFTYILRHTQMLPRQLIAVLNAICRRFRRNGGQLFARQFTGQDIIKGIEDTEDQNTHAVLMMFRPLFNEVDDLFQAVLPRLRREFDYGFLQSIWQSSAKIYMERMNKPDFISFWRLMLATGAMGLKMPEQKSAVYSTARFEFNTKHSISISDKDSLCIHPMFSRIYNLERKRDLKLILPRGSDFLAELEKL